jgi:hypothetical protein
VLTTAHDAVESALVDGGIAAVTKGFRSSSR